LHNGLRCCFMVLPLFSVVKFGDIVLLLLSRQDGSR
jgi:hypothetical protein